MTDIDKIKQAIDVASLIREYRELKPAGTRLKGLCPFHNEKTPSFMVSPERQSWHCFGCGKGGDIFSFVQEIEGMDFRQALQHLATKAGIELTGRVEPKGVSSERQRIKEINGLAARFYHHVLMEMPVGKSARTYLHNRGITDDTIKQWQIGFVPDQWDLLTKYLIKKGSSIDDLVASGLTIKRDNANPKTYKGFYDRFRGRIMFPIRDEHNAVVGFTGRVLVETEKSGGKYVNTPQTPVYDKSRVVFGLEKAKQAIRQQDMIVMVEGQMDVIAVAQSGMKYVVATSGTAMTSQQVHLLKRYSKNMAIAFDDDEAGQKAAKRGIDVALAAGMRVKVIQIPEGAGADPDECVKNSPDTWAQAVADAVDIMPWYVERAFKGKDLSNPQQKQDIAENLVAEIAKIPYPIEQDHWIQTIARKLGSNPQALRKMVDGVGREGPTPVVEEPQPEIVKAKPASRVTLLQMQLLAAVLLHPSVIKKEAFAALEPVYQSATLQGLYDSMKNAYTPNEQFNLSAVQQVHGSMVDSLLLRADEEFSGMNQQQILGTVQSLIAQLSTLYHKERRATLAQQIAQAEAAGDQELLESLLKEFQQVSA